MKTCGNSDISEKTTGSRKAALLAPTPDPSQLHLVASNHIPAHTVIDVEIIAHDIAFGEWKALLAVMTDVTERMRSEVTLRRSRESFQQLFEEAPIGIAMIGSDFAFAKVNRALCELLGYSKEELSELAFDRHPPEFVHEGRLRIDRLDEIDR